VKAQNQGTTENSHVGRNTHTNVRVQNSRFNNLNSIICTVNSSCYNTVFPIRHDLCQEYKRK
jgi:hypothetical protein